MCMHSTRPVDRCLIILSLYARCVSLSGQAERGRSVLVAGDPERAHIRKVEEEGGIHYHVNLVQAMVIT